MLHVASALHFHATTTDDLQDREISAAEIHGVHAKWADGGGASRGADGAF